MHQHCNEVLPLCQLQARNHLWYRLLKAQKAIWNFRQVKARPQNSSTVHDSQINPINYCKAVFQVNIKNIKKTKKHSTVHWEQKSKEAINLKNILNAWSTNPENETDRRPILIGLALAESALSVLPTPCKS